MKKDFSTRLKHFRSLRDLSQAELADMVGISGKQISDYEVGTSKPRQSTFIKLLKALGIDEYTFYNDQTIVPVFSYNDEVAECELITFTGGDGTQISIPKSFLYNFSVNIAEIELHTYYGDAMSPTIQDGDILLVDIRNKILRDADVYLLNLGGTETACRVFLEFDGRIRLLRDNQLYPDQITEKENLNIIGKVVWRGGKI